jgi:23S rRNA (adenine2030-N6)-methyltransferase
MNYRHAYHAGNFADVLKHAVLALVIEHLKLKPQPFRIVDLHAGTGLYDLSGEEAGKTGEWRDGIGRLLKQRLPDDVAAILAPYLDAVRSFNLDHVPGGDIRFYPGSPLLARHLMRPGDQLVANELHAEDVETLQRQLRKVPDTKVLNLDAWQAVKSLLPPKERRGAVLIDPPFELANEFEAIEAGLSDGLKRFANGVYVVWYPIKDPARVTRFLRQIRGLGIAKILNASLSIAARDADAGLTETGLLIINPPFRLKAQLDQILPCLVTALATGPGAGFSVNDWSL